MTPENEKIFRDNYHHWVTLRDAFYLRGLNVHERENILKAAREEFYGQKYNPDMTCPTCIANMMKQVFTQFDDWADRQPITVQTSFPSNK